MDESMNASLFLVYTLYCSRSENAAVNWPIHELKCGDNMATIV